MSRPYTFFWKIGEENQELSQWYMKDITVDGVTYNSCEQYYMAEKAKLFGDTFSLMSIMSSRSVAQQKRIGKSVKNFDAATWAEEQPRVLYTGNMAKFTQHPYLKQFLLSTGESYIAEASPYDKCCGIGYSSETAEDNIDRWGQNLLGEALINVRADILKAKSDVTEVWTDGSCTGNGTPSAKCGIGVFYGDNNIRNTSVSLLHGRVTNNRAELCAILYVLCTNSCLDNIHIHTDSQYSIKAITQYSKKWKKNGWKTTTGAPVESVAIIQYIIALMERREHCGSTTQISYVEAHSVNVNNNKADALARIATSRVVLEKKAKVLMKLYKVPL